MHDADMDKELTEMIERVTSLGTELRSARQIRRSLFMTAAERTLFGRPNIYDTPGNELVLYEPAGELATTSTGGGVPDTSSLAHFNSVIMEELDDMWRTRKNKPLTFRSPEYRTEATNVLIAACDELDRSLTR